ncbi:MAG: O-antigen ligase family protein [Candidatus Coatesbacteria bacterium]
MSPVGFWALLLFSGYLFLGAMGGTFFRMARDNDDLVRMSLVLVAGASLSFVLVRRGLRLPLSLVLPALGFSIACFYSCFDTLNPAESLKDFLKLGTYLLIYLSLAAVAPAPLDPAGRERRRFIAFLCVLAGLALGYLHTPPQPSKAQMYLLGALVTAGAAFWPGALSGRRRLGFSFTGGVLLIVLAVINPEARATLITFRLWATPQVLASLGTTILWGIAFAVFIEAFTVRQSMVRGLAVLVGIACAVGLMQFYGLDQLRPWDPRQPYSIWVRGFMADAVAPLTHGVYQWENNEPYLVVPRILGIYGNPNFFMPFLMQFIPLTVAFAVLNPARRRLSIAATALLMFNMGITETAGGWYALLLLSPVLGTLFGWAAGPLPEAGRPALVNRLFTVSGITAVLGACLLATKDIVFPLFVISLGGLLGLIGWSAARLYRDRLLRVSLGVIVGGAVLLNILGVTLYQHGYKRESIDQRAVKSLMALEMWRGAPLTNANAPLTGIGINAYKSWYPVIQQAVRLPHDIPFETLGSSFTQENRAHNDWLQMLAETGAVGTGMFVWLLLTLFLGALRRLRDDPDLDAGDRATICGLIGSVAIILIYMVPNFPFHIVSSAATWWVMAGLLASYQAEWTLKRRGAGPAGVMAPFGGAWRPALEAAGVGSMVVITIFSAQLFVGTLAYKRAENLWKDPANPDWKRAALTYQEALNLDPFNAQYTYDYGALCFNNAGTDPVTGARASELLTHARTLGFVNEDLEYGLGHLAETHGDYAKALEQYNRATRLNERHEASRQGRIRLMLRPYPALAAALDPGRAQWARARALAKDILKKDPDNYAVLYHLGRISVTPFHDYGLAVDCLKRACELCPVEPDFWQWYGYACAAGGRLEESRVALKRATVLNQGNREARKALDQIEGLLRQNAAAAAPMTAATPASGTASAPSGPPPAHSGGAPRSNPPPAR